MHRMTAVSACVVVGGLVMTGCTVSTGIPGAPDVKIEVALTAAQQACKDFSKAFGESTNPDEMFRGASSAYDAAVSAAVDDPAARPIADALESFLNSTSRTGAEAAVDELMAACNATGLNMSWTD